MHELIGRWVRLVPGDGPVTTGVLLTAYETDEGLWMWTLRTSYGSTQFGGGGLPDEPLTREHVTEVRQARRRVCRRWADYQRLVADDPDVRFVRKRDEALADLHLLNQQMRPPGATPPGLHITDDTTPDTTH
ncbi:hypothetical protein RIF23_14760 [Lipingzhangella sp. LS1_29]|uniref:Uncharacterized protein n=1 Tax=Lipingzhangella rawalii TaxID=2055835 RepID=A0ABU2H8C2_9ACTN|nr:hypothetical protein [Lipingzhangella rawalii]MDS1271558.1 hypothetical protein [Lipingzhangella rawalii]